MQNMLFNGWEVSTGKIFAGGLRNWPRENAFPYGPIKNGY